MKSTRDGAKANAVLDSCLTLVLSMAMADEEASSIFFRMSNTCRLSPSATASIPPVDMDMIDWHATARASVLVLLAPPGLSPSAAEARGERGGERMGEIAKLPGLSVLRCTHGCTLLISRVCSVARLARGCGEARACPCCTSAPLRLPMCATVQS